MEIGEPRNPLTNRASRAPRFQEAGSATVRSGSRGAPGLRQSVLDPAGRPHEGGAVLARPPRERYGRIASLGTGTNRCGRSETVRDRGGPGATPAVPRHRGVHETASTRRRPRDGGASGTADRGTASGATGEDGVPGSRRTLMPKTSWTCAARRVRPPAGGGRAPGRAPETDRSRAGGSVEAHAQSAGRMPDAPGHAVAPTRRSCRRNGRLPAGHRPRSERSATAGARVPEAGGQSVEAPTRSMPSRSAKSV
ncbi:hypothetical protein SsS58_06858 [Streptomyces scabiei]|uniref:Uncharacterized protein n=1 Tax=Streptomyces scabiei TaxID=1930 RepID=A0A117EG13_STRSC|nr:hypothetical protein SsS58_06858 [Streptomyces scabiei]